MRAQRVWGTEFDEPADAVRWLTAVQAQVHPHARWSVGQRTRGGTAEDFDRAFDDGRVLRTHILRPTWHYVTPEDLGWLMLLSGPRLITANTHRYRQLGLDVKVLNKSNDVIAEVVASEHRDRREIAAALNARGLSTEDQRLAYMLMHAELTGVVCSGAMRGKQQTYAAFGERVPEAAAMERDEALAELLRRYFTTRGPATVDDFAWWSGFTLTDSRRALDSVLQDLEHREVDSRTYWFADGSKPTRGTRVDLVQVYDEAVISYRESRDVLQSRGVTFAVPRAIDGYSHVVLADGRLLGHWRVTRVRDRTVLETRLARRISAGERTALARAIDRFGKFLGEPLA